MTLSLLQAAAALLVYPGGLATILVGLAAEVAAARTLGRWPSWSGSWSGTTGELLDAARNVRPAELAAIPLAFLAAAQVVAPLHPVPSADRNVLVAATALVIISAATPGPAWGRDRTLLLAQLGWLVAVMAPAMVTPDVRPQVLGAVLLPMVLPLKVLAGLLYLACLPEMLQVGTSSGGLVRSVLWLPYCGLLGSLLLPPPGEDALGLARFFLTLALAVGLAIGLGALTRRSGGRLAGAAYPWVVATLALATGALGIILSLLFP